MSSMLMRRAALCFAVSALFALGPRPAHAGKLETAFSEKELLAAFDKVLDDPFFERFTGLKIYDKTSLSKPDRAIGGTQSFRFEKFCVTKTVTQTQHSSTNNESRYDGVYQVTRSWTETQTNTKSTNEVRYISYLPTLELTKKPGTVKLYCEAGEFSKDPGGKGVNPFAVLGGLAGAVSKGISLGILGGSSWSTTECSWSPFDPTSYPLWIEGKWLNWRLQQFLPGGEDKLARAFDLFGKKKYAEAQPLFEELAAHFGYTKKAVPKSQPEYKVWPYAYSCDMPEIFAILGDIYRLHLKDMTKAEEYYRIAYSVGGSPYLAETAGIARANRGLGYTLSERARAAAGGPDKELFAQLGKGAAFHLYAYIGFYKDRMAPDHDEVMKTIKEIDPDEIQAREKEAERQKKNKEALNEEKKQKEKINAIMEY
ncbi:MAG: hypothetical protein PHV36_01235 [Elusimicrobiales bacterium]|nr:hypothetical protein [Elusimicrobiales bacterium]